MTRLGQRGFDPLLCAAITGLTGNQADKAMIWKDCCTC